MKDMNEAPKNGKMVVLFIKPDTEAYTPFEDSLEPYKTIGFNNLDMTGLDEWQFAGWDWCHDCFTDGAGEPIGWLPFEPTGD